MSFLSFEFIVFFVGVLTCYYAAPKDRQNLVLLIASMAFVVSWHWSFLLIHLLMSTAGYGFGLKIHQSDGPNNARRWLWLSIGFQLGALFYFKYLNLWNINIDLVENASAFEGYSLSLLIPVGISYYTFQIVAYQVDIYRKQISPETRLSRFYLFTLFFPQLLMGPIERFSKLGPQFDQPRRLTTDLLFEGGYLISLGLFKRFVVANMLSPIYLHSIKDGYSVEEFGLFFVLEVIAGYVYFYCDFSSYMDLVRGGAKLLGLNMSRNFNQPYFSTNPIASWQRWHMTLTFWIRDYVYLPLLLKTKRPLFSIFFLFLGLAFFHEVSFRYFLWALYWTALAALYMLYSRKMKPKFAVLRSSSLWVRSAKISVTFLVVCYISLFSWIQSWDQLVAATANLFVPAVGYSRLLDLGPIALWTLLAAVLFIVIQESRKAKAQLELAGVAFLNITLAFALGSFQEYPFQYLNF